MSPELDPRIERSRRVIAEATVAEMAEVGYGAMTIEGIAKRAGVSKATIYRQWAGKLELIEAALEMLKADMTIDTSAPPLAQLRELLTWLASYLGDADNPGSACVPAIVSAAQYDPAVREFHHRFTGSRRQLLIDIIEAGQRAGEIDADADSGLTAELLVGPIFYRRLMTDTPFPVEEIDAILDAVIGTGSAD